MPDNDSPQIEQEIAAPSCNGCPYYFTAHPQRAVGQCRESGPTPLVAGWNQTLEGQPPKPIVLGYFPPTSKDIVCGRHPLFMAYQQQEARRQFEKMMTDEPTEPADELEAARQRFREQQGDNDAPLGADTKTAGLA